MEPAASLGVESDSTDPTADSRGWHFAAPEYYTLAMESLEAVAVAEEKKKELKNLVKLLMYREM